MVETREEILKKHNIKLSEYTQEESYTDELLQAFLEHDGYNYDLNPSRGQVLQGEIIGQNKNNVLIDIGYKDFVSVELKKEEIHAIRKMELQSGDNIDVYITDMDTENYQIKGSISQIHKNETYEDIIDNIDTATIQAKVLSSMPAGYNIELTSDSHKIPAFMPKTLAGINKLDNPESIVGDTFTVMVESYSRDKGTFIVSRKRYLKTLIPNEIEKLQTVDSNGVPVQYAGKVTGTTAFGIFVEFNECLTGMIHKDNMTEECYANLKNIQPGQMINFYIKEIVRNKLILTQTWRKTLWDTITEGDSFEGTVAGFIDFGALVQLDNETKGLIHNTELNKVSRNYKVDDKIDVKVMSVQRMERKIYLTIEKKQ